MATNAPQMPTDPSLEDDEQKLEELGLIVSKKERDIERLETEAKEILPQTHSMRVELLTLYRRYTKDALKLLEKKEKLVKVQRDGKYVLEVNPSILENCKKSHNFQEFCLLKFILNFNEFFSKIEETNEM